LDYIVLSSLGEDCSRLTQKKSEGFWANYNIPASETGILEEIWIEPEFQEKHVVEYVSEYKKGDCVKQFQNGSDAVGLVIMRFENREEMLYYLEHITDYIWVITYR